MIEHNDSDEWIRNGGRYDGLVYNGTSRVYRDSPAEKWGLG